jgi:Zn-dependent metalloprotease
MNYGDGSRNPKALFTSCDGFSPLVSLDVAAHEMTHGVTQHNNGLLYEVRRALLPACRPACVHVTLWPECISTQFIPPVKLTPATPSFLVKQWSFGGINEALSDIFAMCVMDYAHSQGTYPKPADFLIGSTFYPQSLGCEFPFLRSMMDPLADGGYSFSCWNQRIDEVVSHRTCCDASGGGYQP